MAEHKQHVTGMRLDQELHQIYRLLTGGMTDREIMEKLGLKESTYYWYKRKMHKRYASVQRKETEESVYHEQQLLTDRLIKTYRDLELKYANDHKTMTGFECAEVARIRQELAINIFRLKAEGFRATRRLNDVQQKANRYLVTNRGQLEDQSVPDNTNTVQQQ